MRNLPFVLWMLLWPLFSAAIDYLEFLQGKIFSETTVTIVAFIYFGLWIFIGHLVYEKKNIQPEK